MCCAHVVLIASNMWRSMAERVFFCIICKPNLSNWKLFLFVIHGHVTIMRNRVKLQWKRDQKCNLYDRWLPETYFHLLFMLCAVVISVNNVTHNFILPFVTHYLFMHVSDVLSSCYHAYIWVVIPFLSELFFRELLEFFLRSMFLCCFS